MGNFVLDSEEGRSGEFRPEDSYWKNNVSDIRFVAWDTETTGVSSRFDYLVEIAALAFSEDFEHRSFQSLIKPPISIPPQVIAIHGITDAMVRSSPSMEVVGSQFFEFLGWVGTPRVLIAHNAAFDVQMFLSSLSKAQISAKWKGVTDTVPEIVIDTCALARNLVPESPRHSLAALVEFFGISAQNFHRAAADVKILKEVFLRLLAIAADKRATREGLTLEMLVDLSGGYHLLDPYNKATSKRALVASGTSFQLPQKLRELQELCGSDCMVSIVYETDTEARYITPIGFKNRASRVYLEAFCHRDNIKKTFRVDRILKVGNVL